MNADAITVDDALDALARARAEGMDICLDGRAVDFDAYSATVDDIPLHYAGFETGADGCTYVRYKGLHHRLHLARRVEVPFTNLLERKED